MYPVAEPFKGSVQTVLGSISPEELGVTLCHEHCLIDLSGVFTAPREATKRKIAFEPVSFENVYYIRYHPTECLDNLRLLEEDRSIEELAQFAKQGGRTLIDHTNADLARDPLALVRISLATGLNIVMGSGYYVAGAQDEAVMRERTEQDIAEEIIREIRQGVGDTGIRVGLIGEIGCSWPLEEAEKKIVRAAGLAQKETGAPLSIHPGRQEDTPAELVNLLSEVGANVHHTLICHVERTVFDSAKRYRLAEAGCYLAYDLWGNEGYYPEVLSIIDVPNDTQRIAQIKDLIEHGFGSQILISHDICYKCRYIRFGGHGYGHIMENAIPAMRGRGLTEEQIQNLLIDNPGRFFSFW